jgi:Ca2+-binding RTX toxin-like protein
MLRKWLEKRARVRKQWNKLARRARPDMRLRPHFEAFERRNLMAASAVLADGILTVTGSEADDSIVFRQVENRITVDGVSGFFEAGQIRQIVVNALAGNDTVNLDSGAIAGQQPITIASSVNGGTGNDFITGGAANDVLFGEFGDDVLLGGDGNDTIQGGAGNDQLDGGIGDDGLFGHEGNDTLRGGAGNDTLQGGEGDDTLVSSDTVVAYTGQQSVLEMIPYGNGRSKLGR